MKKQIHAGLAALRALVLMASFPVLASAAVSWYGFTPVVIDADNDASVTFTARTDGSDARLELVLSNGEVRAMEHQGEGLYTVTLSRDEALFGYGAEDVNRNVVGYLDGYDEADVRQYRLNIVINVFDQNIPPVPVSDLADDVHVSTRIFNLYQPGIDPQNVIASAVIKRFYEHFPDDFDFIAVMTLPSFTGNRYFQAVRNAVEGIGLSVFDGGEYYGSEQRLKGYVRYPISTFYDLGERTFSHEIGHKWINFLSHPKLQGVTPHWPLSSLARGVMGYQTTSQGLNFPYDITPLGDDRYRLDFNSAPATFHGMDLYLMGLGPAERAGSYVVFENQQQAVVSGGILEGPVVDFGVDDVIEMYGPRVPAYPDSQISFRVATIIVSRDGLLSDIEMAFFDHFAARGEATEPLPYAQGLASGITNPFKVATGYIGTVYTALSGEDLFAVNAGLNDAWYNLNTPGQGLLITFFPVLQKVFVAIFTFDTERPPESAAAILGGPGQRWVTGLGDYQGNRAVANLELTSGGIFDSVDPSPSQNQGYGTLALEFSDCSHGTVTYTIPSAQLRGIIPITRVADDNVALCEQLGQE